MITQEQIDKGLRGELAFKEWLDQTDLSYVYINQSIETQSTLFRNTVKRPDFFVLIDSIGLLAIDVKNKELSGNVYTLQYEDEAKKALNFERHYRLPMWYVYYNEENCTWFWISALKANEVGELRNNTSDGKKFLALQKSDFVEVNCNEDLGKLFTQRMGSFV